jgi:hypothetical protein
MFTACILSCSALSYVAAYFSTFSSIVSFADKMFITLALGREHLLKGGTLSTVDLLVQITGFVKKGGKSL